MCIFYRYTGGWISVKAEEEEEDALLQRLTDPTGSKAEGEEGGRND